MNQRLYRSPDDRIIAGVAGGLAETYDLDPALVRVGWAFLIIVTGGLFLLLYIVMAIVVPLRLSSQPLWAAPGPNSTSQIWPDASSAPMGDPSTPPPGPDALGSAMSGSAPVPPRAYGYRRREHRDSSAALVFGVILIAVGFFFLFRQFIPALDLDLIWPLIVLFGGVLLIAGALNRPRRTL